MSSVPIPLKYLLIFYLIEEYIIAANFSGSVKTNQFWVFCVTRVIIILDQNIFLRPFLYVLIIIGDIDLRQVRYSLWGDVEVVLLLLGYDTPEWSLHWTLLNQCQ